MMLCCDVAGEGLRGGAGWLVPTGTVASVLPVVVSVEGDVAGEGVGPGAVAVVIDRRSDGDGLTGLGCSGGGG